VNRRRVLFFLAVVAVFAAMYVLYSAIDTLRQLDRIEAERDTWQRPADVIAALNLHAGDTMVDLGSGAGYFALKLSGAVGRRGNVIAVDVRRLSLTFLWIRAALRGAHNVHAVVTEEDDPHLPSNGADAVLIANTYHEFRDPQGMLRHVSQALRSGGRLVIVDRGPRAGIAGNGHELPINIVEKQLTDQGFQLIGKQDSFIDLKQDEPWWILIARKP
jgi:ubiquinone/menaquinone biosynthesis C-methylase UbiE